MSLVITFSVSKPFKYNIWLSFPPPVIPNSVCFASPGPLTTQPMMDNVIGFFIWDNLLSNSLTVSITWKACLAQDGHEIIFTPLFLKLRDFKISLPTLISSTGSSESDTLIVSPIPSNNKLPNPIEVLMLPGK